MRDDAIPIYERNLPGRPQAALGTTDPSILTFRSRLARLYQKAGRLDEAIALYERTLTDQRQILGETHANTMITRNPDIAHVSLPARRVELDEAIPVLERTLTDRERTLGDTHPHTVTTRNNLASAYEEAGRRDDAQRLRDRLRSGRGILS